MTKTLPLPKFPAIPLRALVRPMLFAALGLHALVLFVPFPQERQKPPDTKETPVKITQLPTTKATTQNKTPKVEVVRSKPPLPKLDRPNPNPNPRSAPEPIQQQEAGQPESSAPPAATAQPNPKGTDTAKGVDFPHYQPSTGNCFGKGLGENCRVATADLKTVTAFYLSAPKAKGFTLTPDEDSDSRRIYTVTTPDKKTLFLHLFKDEPTTVILLNETKVPDLATLKGSITIPGDYYQLLTDLVPQVDRSDNPQTNAQPQHFAQPQLFYKEISNEDIKAGLNPDTLPGIDGSPTLVLGQAPDSFYQTMAAAGLSGTFEVTTQGEYGGGKVYRLKKDSTTFYMNLVPTKDQKGTIVVTWLKNPRG